MCSTLASPVEALAEVERLLTAVVRAPADPGLLAAARRLQAQAESIVRRSLRAAETSESWRAQGAASPAAWAKSQAGMSTGQACRELALARRLEQLPIVDDAVSGGAISSEHAATIARETKHLTPEQRRQVELALVKKAFTLDPHELATEARRRVAEVSQQAIGDATAERHRRRSATRVRRADGGWRWIIDPDDEGHEMLSGAVSTVLRGDRRDHDDRTGEQKLHDALTEVARRSVAGRADGPARPLLIVTVTLDELRRGDDQPLIDPATLGATNPIVRATLDRLSCDAAVRRVVLDPAGEVLDVGRTKRTATPAQRDALLAIWGGCARKGCSRGPDWVELHHVTPWRLGGSTDLAGLRPMCGEDHHAVHDLGQTIELKDGTWIGPTGWVNTHDPPADAAA